MKKLLLFGLILLLSLNIVSCRNSQSKTERNSSIKTSAALAKNVSSTQFHELIDTKKNIQLLDVRTPEEAAEGVIDGCVALDYHSPKFKENLNKLNKEAPVLIYCAVGGRSGNAMQMMQQMGFKEVYNLSGGIKAWAGQGLPIKK